MNFYSVRKYRELCQKYVLIKGTGCTNVFTVRQFLVVCIFLAFHSSGEINSASGKEQISYCPIGGHNNINKQELLRGKNLCVARYWGYMEKEMVGGSNFNLMKIHSLNCLRINFSKTLCKFIIILIIYLFILFLYK